MVRTKLHWVKIFVTCLFIVGLIFPSPTSAQVTGNLDVATFNVESPRFCSPGNPDGQPSETDPEIVAQHFSALAGPQIWALSEVPDESTAKRYRDAAEFPGSDFQLIMGTKGTCFDKLAILFDQNTLTLVEPSQELESEVGGDRDPLAAHFRDKDNGTEFWVVANHFARGNESGRNRQAQNVTSSRHSP